MPRGRQAGLPAGAPWLLRDLSLGVGGLPFHLSLGGTLAGFSPLCQEPGGRRKKVDCAQKGSWVALGRGSFPALRPPLLSLSPPPHTVAIRPGASPPHHGPNTLRNPHCPRHPLASETPGDPLPSKGCQKRHPLTSSLDQPPRRDGFSSRSLPGASGLPGDAATVRHVALRCPPGLLTPEPWLKEGASMFQNPQPLHPHLAAPGGWEEGWKGLSSRRDRAKVILSPLEALFC